MNKARHRLLTVTAGITLLAASASGQVIYPPGVSGPAVLPEFDAADFGLPTFIDNPYFPLVPGTSYTYSGQREDDGETVTETSTIAVTSDTRNVAGVESRAVRDTEFVDGVLTEDTFDWYAQDVIGNVWYMGEFTTVFEYDDEGNVTGTSNEGSWEAGVDGALPGYIMPAFPQIGDHYYQEFLSDEAVDEAVIVSLDESVSIGLGDFSNVLQTYETSALEPDSREFKYYAPGVGLILIEEDLNAQLMDPEFISELQGVQVIPAPMSLLLAAVGLGCVGRVRRRLK
jgi:hypothetical protein